MDNSEVSTVDNKLFKDWSMTE